MTENLVFLQRDWCDLSWSEWVPFEKRATKIPVTSGLYRVKPASKNKLIYIGQTSNLKRRIGSLISESKQPDMPFRDPHNGAPCLWAWQKEEEYLYEYSYAEFEDSEILRRTFEHYLFWKYRLEHGESPLCSFGKFHKNYKISSNRASGLHGHRLINEINQAGLNSHEPLLISGRFVNDNWMGLNWTKPLILKLANVRMLENQPAVYKIFTTQELLYVGETNVLQNRMMSHSKKTWSNSEVYFSCSPQSANILPHQLKEIENDLIACCFEQEKRAPLFQFRNHM